MIHIGDYVKFQYKKETRGGFVEGATRDGRLRITVRDLGMKARIVHRHENKVTKVTL